MPTKESIILATSIRTQLACATRQRFADIWSKILCQIRVYTPVKGKS